MYIPSKFIPEYRTARKHSLLSTNGWWLNRWPILGWLETFVKIAAWCFVPFIHSIPKQPLSTVTQLSGLTPTFATQTFLMFIASFGMALAILDRLNYRELVSILFVFPNNWAHWSVFLAMYRNGRVALNIRYFRMFCCLMLAGDLIKLLFFAVHDFKRLGISRFAVYFLVSCYVVIYGLVLLLDYTYVSITSQILVLFYRYVVIPTLRSLSFLSPNSLYNTVIDGVSAL